MRSVCSLGVLSLAFAVVMLGVMTRGPAMVRVEMTRLPFPACEEPSDGYFLPRGEPCVIQRLTGLCSINEGGRGFCFAIRTFSTGQDRFGNGHVLRLMTWWTKYPQAPDEGVCVVRDDLSDSEDGLADGVSDVAVFCPLSDVPIPNL